MIRDARSQWRSRVNSPVALYLTALAVLAAIALAFSIALAVGGSFSSSARQRLLGAKKSQIAVLNANLLPFRGVAKDIHATRSSITTFYTNRISATYSQVTHSIGTIAIQSGVRLSQISYAEGKPGLDLTEVSMDVGISGSYPQLMQFVNGLERDHLFFVVRALSFTGQQGGIVSLRIRISTWMRQPDAPQHQIAFSESGPRPSASDTQFRPGGK